jgi:hypothetical protein
MAIGTIARRAKAAPLAGALRTGGQRVVGMKAGGEGNVTELVDGDLGKELVAEIQGKAGLKRSEHLAEFAAAHGGQAANKFVQFVVGHGGYTLTSNG